jgi:hypothetical protein
MLLLLPSALVLPKTYWCKLTAKVIGFQHSARFDPYNKITIMSRIKMRPLVFKHLFNFLSVNNDAECFRNVRNSGSSLLVFF